MDLIDLLRALLDPMAEQLSIIPDDAVSPQPGRDNTPDILEGHAMLGDGRMALFGFYQHAAQQTITGEMWVTGGAMGPHHMATVGPVARRHQTWSYDPGTDDQDLGRTIIAEFVAWIDEFSQPREPVVEAQHAHA